VPPLLRLLAGAALVLALSGCDPVLIPRHQHIPPGLVYAAPTADGELAGASCLNDDDCWAVGRTSATLRDSRAVLDHFQAKGWGPASAPDPGAAAALYAVTCMRTANCWAVGAIDGPTGRRSLLEEYDGSSWSIVAGRGNTDGGLLDGLTCVTAADCWAVGSSGTAVQQTLIEHYDGTDWTTVARPNPATAGPDALDGVACSAATDCWAVGQTAGRDALIEQWDGRSWTVVRSAATAADASSSLNGVTCTVTAECWAVGSSSRGATESALVEHYVDGRWAAVQSPTSVFDAGASLEGVTCFTGGNCWAVGSAHSATGLTRTLVQHYAGDGPWSSIETPALGAGASAALRGVTCFSDDDCWAVGTCSARALSQCAASTSLIELYDTVLPDGH
jgi:hypothetical protein